MGIDTTEGKKMWRHRGKVIYNLRKTQETNREGRTEDCFTALRRNPRGQHLDFGRLVSRIAEQ